MIFKELLFQVLEYLLKVLVIDKSLQVTGNHNKILPMCFTILCLAFQDVLSTGPNLSSSLPM